MEKYTLKFSTAQLDKIIAAICADWSLLTKRFMNTVSQYFNNLDSRSVSEYEKEVRVYLIRTISAFRLANPAIPSEQMFGYLDLDGIYKERANQVLEFIGTLPVSQNEVTLINEMISREINFAFMGESLSDFDLILQDYQANNYSSVAEIVDRFEECINRSNISLKKYKTIETSENESLDLSNIDDMTAMVNKIVDKDRNPSSRIKTGLKTLNKMLGGGFEGSRVYVAMGMPKSGKSSLLMNIWIWAKLYNKLKTKTPGKKPVVLMISQENTIEETVRRIYSHFYGNTITFGDKTKEEMLDDLVNKTDLFNDRLNDTQLKILYKPNRGITTTDVDDIISDINSNTDGEVVMVIQDYLMRIKSSNWKINKTDTKTEYGDIVNEFSVIARAYDIPIITAHQMNREANRIFEEAQTLEEKLNVTKKLNSSQVGESIDVIRNCDYAFLLAKTSTTERISPDPAIDPIVHKHMHFKEIATRMVQSNITSFVHPFLDNNDMSLDEDEGLSYTKSIMDTEMSTLASDMGNKQAALYAATDARSSLKKLKSLSIDQE